MPGCPQPSGPTLDETKNQIEEAEQHLEAVARLEAQRTYPQEFTDAQNDYFKAEEHLKAARLKEAYMAAAKSLRTSQKILKKFYLDTIAVLAQKAKIEIQQIVKDDPDSSLKDLIEPLDEITDYAEKIENDQEIVALNTVINHLDRVIQIAYNARVNVKETMADVSFEQGQYHLSPEGKRLLEGGLFAQIMTGIQEYLNQYPGRTIEIKIKVVGYTDEMGFKEGTTLIQELIKEVEDQVPNDKDERKKFLNQRLSEFRATTIADYLEQLILKSGQANSRVQIEKEIIGRGEEIPPGVEPPYPPSDPRRRICKISSYITTK